MQSKGSVFQCRLAEKTCITARKFLHFVQLFGSYLICLDVLEHEIFRGLYFLDDAGTSAAGGEVIYFFHGGEVRIYRGIERVIYIFAIK